MNQDFVKKFVMKVKIQTRLSDLVPDGEPKTSKSEDGRINGDFLACCLPPREMVSVPSFKGDEVAIQDIEKNLDDSKSTADDPMVKLHQGGPNRPTCLRRKSVASSSPAIFEILEQETTRPILKKCSSLRNKRQGQGRRQGAEENKIVR